MDARTKEGKFPLLPLPLVFAFCGLFHGLLTWSLVRWVLKIDCPWWWGPTGGLVAGVVVGFLLSLLYRL